MSVNHRAERLTPLDVQMPASYIPVLLIFRTTEPATVILPRLQLGLERLVEYVPWLAGRVHYTTQKGDGKEAQGPEIRWDSGGAPLSIVDRGSVLSSSYEALAAQGMPSEAFPADMWPVAMTMFGGGDAAGEPVFTASFFRFADGQGAGLCVCMHHGAVDGTGFDAVVGLWTRCMAAGDAPPHPDVGRSRSERLSDALAPNWGEAAAMSEDDMLRLHPEYAREAPPAPAAMPPCRFGTYNVSLARLRAVKEQLGSHLSFAPSTSMVLASVLWSAAARGRARDGAEATRKLVVSVNGRPRIGDGFSTAEAPYLGNFAFATVVELPAETLAAAQPEGAAVESLARVCRAVHQAVLGVDARYITRACRLLDGAAGRWAVRFGWDLTSGHFLGFNSWAGLCLYDADFGAGLGTPEFVRLPSGGPADGLCLVLPRKRVLGSSETSEVALQVILSLRSDELTSLENDATWRALVDW
ncbi:hypothetical protein HIM_12702 [Hirsutella minnesotensis 3608]|uniref:Uncharacterized protein n=1 Tax=Hirsutella minnesotensis 3608 TaxID=1043627 RepID=A0A0F7ZZS9_9HYPO|nr:hypothetical protein HIM_12702 [Hirsutella minnesotensis 3608]